MTDLPLRWAVPHPNPCEHKDDPCIDGTHYCEQMPCVMEDKDVRWPCPFAVMTPAHPTEGAPVTEDARTSIPVATPGGGA